MTSATVPQQHAAYLALVPALEARARRQFRYRSPADADEAVADVVALGFAAYLRLAGRGVLATDFPAAFARFAVLAVAAGRAVGRRLSTRDVMAKAAQRRRGFAVHGLDDRTPSGDGWWRDLVADRRARVCDQAIFNLDFPAWFASLAPAKAKVAQFLAAGYSTDATARLAGVSPGRVSQLRRELADSWSAFAGGL